MTRSVRLVAIISAVVVLLGGGVFVGYRLLTNRVNAAIPQADLFGDATPSPSSAGSPSPTPSPTPPPGADIKGPLNILIIGVDTREFSPSWLPHSDAIMIMHVNADLTKAYLTSIPRDLVLDVPAFPPAQLGARRTRITNAMALGSRVPGSSIPNPAQGFQLVAKALSAYTGITRFDAGALLTFTGLRNLVNAIGGIDLYIDQQIVSIHMRPDGKHRTPCGSCEHGYSGPRATYNVGTQHLVGWQVLDIARQRYLAGGDYTRQRHQRQIIKAIIAKVISTGFSTDLVGIQKLITALGKTLVFDGRGRAPTEFAYALRNLSANSITLVGLPGASLHSGGQYAGESLQPIQATYFTALRQDKLDAFVAAHPNLVNSH